MKRIVKILMFALVMVSMIACGKGGETSKKDEVVVWKLGHNANKDHLWNKTALKFAELVSEKSKGKMEIKVFNGQLGSETDMINSVRMGTLDMVLTGETLQNWAPKAALMAVPYAFTSNEQMEKVLNGPIGQEIRENIEEKAGLMPLYYHLRAPRQLTTNEDIKSVDDLNGLVIRVPDVPVFVKTWQALGAKPTPMSLQEVFTSLQNNTIQAQENPYDLIDSLGFYEVQKYAYETEHVRQWIYSVAGVKQFNALSPKLQKIVKESAKEAQDYAQNKFVAYQKEVKQDLISKGMIIRKMDQDAMRAKVLPELETILTSEQFDIYKRIQEVK
jgi:tripartite ATP-independent transporter DctP family solute receptor